MEGGAVVRGMMLGRGGFGGSGWGGEVGDPGLLVHVLPTADEALWQVPNCLCLPAWSLNSTNACAYACLHPQS